MRIPDFADFLRSVDIEELRKLTADKTPGVKVVQFNRADDVAVSNFFNLYRQEIFNSDQRLILAYLKLYHRWLQDALADE